MHDLFVCLFSFVFLFLSSTVQEKKEQKELHIAIDYILKLQFLINVKLCIYICILEILQSHVRRIYMIPEHTPLWKQVSVAYLLSLCTYESQV